MNLSTTAEKFADTWRLWNLAANKGGACSLQASARTSAAARLANSTASRDGISGCGAVMPAVIQSVQVTSHWTVTVTDRVVRPYWLVAYSL
jgi:hypothetical protein